MRDHLISPNKVRPERVAFLVLFLLFLLVAFLGMSLNGNAQVIPSVIKPKVNSLFTSTTIAGATQQQSDMTVLYGRLDSLSLQIRNLESRIILLQLKCRF